MKASGMYVDLGMYVCMKASGTRVDLWYICAYGGLRYMCAYGGFRYVCVYGGLRYAELPPQVLPRYVCAGIKS